MKLYLIPTSLNDTAVGDFYGQSKLIGHLRYFLVEHEKSARRFLKKVDHQFPVQECVFFEVSEHTKTEDTRKFLEDNKNREMGVMSEAGCPCVADPGADVVMWAHEKGWEVVPLVGPSAIILALMSSGLNGQNFAFNGYLPKDKNERAKKIRLLEKRSREENQTQIVMETPYRNQSLFEELLTTLQSTTLLCIAMDLTGQKQCVKTQHVSQWRKAGFHVDKVPTLFLLGCA